MSRSSPWIKPFLLLVLALSVPPTLYWFGYVQQSVIEAKQQAFITLSEIAAQVQERLTAYDAMAQSAELTSTKSLKPYLLSLLPTKRVDVSKASRHLAIETDGLHVNVVGQSEARAEAPAKESTGDQDRSVLSAVVALDDLVPWDLVQSEFDGILVLDEKSRLLTQDRRLPKQTVGTPIVLRNNDMAFDLAELLAVEPRKQPQAESNLAKRTGEANLWSPLSFSSEPTVRIAGIDYVTFVQPIRAAVSNFGKPPTNKPTHLFICGLVVKQRLRQEAIGLAPVALVVVISLIAFGLFTISYLKLRFIGPTERMKRSDIWLLVGSLLCATALALMLILQANAMRVLQDDFDRGLAGVSKAIATETTKEVKEVQEQLQASTAEWTRTYADPDEVKGSVLSTSYVFAYPDFEALFEAHWAQDGGTQQHKWMPRTMKTPLVSLADGFNFDNVMALALATKDTCASNNTCEPKFAFSKLVTPTSGLSVATFAVPKPVNGVKDAHTSTEAIVLATAFRSLHEPIMPHPYQFVMLDEHGRVVFQSAQGPFERERFFDSMQDGPSLERAARLQEPGIREHRCRTHVYRLHTRRIEALNATLVTYYETTWIGSLAAQSFAASALFAFALVVAMLGAAAISRACFGESAFDWAWPSVTRNRNYLVGMVLAFTVALVLFAATRWLPTCAVPWTLLVLPASVVFALGVATHMRLPFFVVEHFKRQRGLDQALHGQHWLFVATAVMYTLALVAVPVTIAFEDAFAVYRAAFADSRSRKFEAEAKKRDAQWDAKFVSLDRVLEPADCEQESAFDARCAASERVFASPSNYARLQKLRKRGRYHDCAGQDRESACVQMPAGKAPSSFMVPFAARVARFGADRAELRPSLAAFSQANSVEAATAVFPKRDLSLAEFGGLVALLASLWMLVRSICGHVLGLGLDGDGVLSRADEVRPKDGTRWLLLRPPPSAYTGQVGDWASRIQWLDLRTLQTVAQLSGQTTAPGNILGIEHVETKLADLEWRNALLQLLGTPQAGALVLVSEIDPLHFVGELLRERTHELHALAANDVARLAQEAVCTSCRDELALWATALRDVEKIRYDLPDSPASSSPSAARLTTRLRDECKWSEPLRQIGARLEKRSTFADLSWEQLVGFVQDAAEPYYRSIWELCSREEQLAMVQLAQEGLVNPKRVELLRRLARRRLVSIDPRFRLMNESFLAFVRSAESGSCIAAWERSTATATWSRIAIPLYALGTMIVAILLFTEQVFISNVVAMVTGAAATVGSLRGLYMAARQRSGTDAA